MLFRKYEGSFDPAMVKIENITCAICLNKKGIVSFRFLK